MEDRRQKTEDRRQKTEDRRQKTEGYPSSVVCPPLLTQEHGNTMFVS